jgi:isopenicillin N synthase-like dioxygenase
MSNDVKVHVLDMNAPDFVPNFIAACRRPGAVLITGHGIPQELIDAAYAEWMPEKGGFFALPDAVKQQFLYSDLSPKVDDPESGFYPFKSEKGSDHKGTNKGSVNLNEYYHIKTALAGTYPTTGDFTATKLLAELNWQLVAKLLKLLDAHGPSKADAPYFGQLAEQISAGKWSTFRILHYPPVPMPADGNDDEIELIKVHKDKGCVTTVISPSASGLAVEDPENPDAPYMRAPHMPGSILFQIGEGLELMSNGFYKAGRHTVMGRPSKLQGHRTSMARFWHFEPETKLADGMTNGDMMRKYWEKKDLKV